MRDNQPVNPPPLQKHRPKGEAPLDNDAAADLSVNSLSQSAARRLSRPSLPRHPARNSSGGSLIPRRSRFSICSSSTTACRNRSKSLGWTACRRVAGRIRQRDQRGQEPSPDPAGRPCGSHHHRARRNRAEGAAPDPGGGLRPWRGTRIRTAPFSMSPPQPVERRRKSEDRPGSQRCAAAERFRGLAEATPKTSRKLFFSEDDQYFYITVDGETPEPYRWMRRPPS